MNDQTIPSATRRPALIAGTLLGAVFLGAAALGPAAAQAKEKALEVIVGNDDSNPVVVSGSVTGSVDATVTNTVPVTGSVDANIVDVVSVTGTVDIAGPVSTRSERGAFTCRVEIDVPANTVGVTESDACPALTSDRQFVITQAVIQAFSIPSFPAGASVDAQVNFFHDGNAPAAAALAFGTSRGPDLADNFLGFDNVGPRVISGSEQMETWLHPNTYSTRVRVSTNYSSLNPTEVTVLLSGYSMPNAAG